MQSKVHQFLGGSPTGLAESSSQYSYGLVIRLRLLSTLPHGNAVTTFDYGLVTLARTGLSPDNSNAFTGALAGTRRVPSASVVLGVRYGTRRVPTTSVIRDELVTYQ